MPRNGAARFVKSIDEKRSAGGFDSRRQDFLGRWSAGGLPIGINDCYGASLRRQFVKNSLPAALPIAHLTAVGQAELDVLIAGQAGTPIRDLLRSDVLELPERGAARN